MREQDEVQTQPEAGEVKPAPTKKRTRARKVLVLKSAPEPAAPLTAEQVRAKLKAERVQEALLLIPEWAQLEDGESLQRVRQFPQAAAAKAYAGFALEIATAFKLPISLQWADRQLVITLRGYSQKSRQSGVTMAMVNLATTLG